MRNEQDMMGLILRVAREDEHIRAALLVGSRANPMAPRDLHMDYDITYFVTDMAPYYDNMSWIEAHFGKPSVAQLPENMDLLPPEGDGHFTYLMMFEDGVRIDLSLQATPYVDDGEPAIVLLDKDGTLPALSEPSDKLWHVTPFTQKLFSDCCNEFWWCLNNVGKGIARDELPYAMKMFHVIVRDMLDQMLEWHIGIHHPAVSAGKFHKYFKRYLPEELYRMYAETYSTAEPACFWAAVWTACDLFHTVALQVAAHEGYVYNQREEEGMRAYLSVVNMGMRGDLADKET